MEVIPELVRLEATDQPSLPTYETIVQRLDQLSFPTELQTEISDLMSSNKTYIVRSSGLMEDHASTSLLDSMTLLQIVRRLMALLLH